MNSLLLWRRKARHWAAKQLSHLTRGRCITSKCASPQTPVWRAPCLSLAQFTKYLWLSTLQTHSRVALPGSFVVGRYHRSSISQSVVSTVTCAPSWIKHISASVRAVFPSAHAIGKVPADGFTVNQSPQVEWWRAESPVHLQCSIRAKQTFLVYRLWHLWSFLSHSPTSTTLMDENHETYSAP